MMIKKVKIFVCIIISDFTDILHIVDLFDGFTIDLGGRIDAFYRPA